MATVHETTIPSKAFYARFHDESGYLTKYDGDLLFLADGTTTPHVIEPAEVCEPGCPGRSRYGRGPVCGGSARGWLCGSGVQQNAGGGVRWDAPTR